MRNGTKVPPAAWVVELLRKAIEWQAPLEFGDTLSQTDIARNWVTQITGLLVEIEQLRGWRRLSLQKRLTLFIAS